MDKWIDGSMDGWIDTDCNIIAVWTAIVFTFHLMATKSAKDKTVGA